MKKLLSALAAAAVLAAPVVAAPAAEAADYTRNGMSVGVDWSGAWSRYAYGDHFVDGWCKDGSYFRGPVRGAYSTSKVWYACLWNGGVDLVRGRTASGTTVAPLWA